jgi:hypothetical protein
MIQDLDKDLQPLIAGKLFVKIAIGFFGLGKAAEYFGDLLHGNIINLAAQLSERF